MSEPDRTRLAVLGSPIAHSKSPAIQRAAYGVLGLDWSYEAIEVTGDRLPDFMESLDGSWRGLSLTMPLKRDVIPLLAKRDALVDRVGAANTVLLTSGGPIGFNTDVRGAVESLRGVGLQSVRSALLLGAGATAASVLVALVELGVRDVHVSARSVERASALVDLAEREGVNLVVRPWGVFDRSLRVPDVVVSTLPGGQNDLEFPEALRSIAVLFDVAYDPWPSELARAWQRVGGTVVSGLDLLLHQAIGQIRIFVSEDLDVPLERETDVLAAMRVAIA